MLNRRDVLNIGASAAVASLLVSDASRTEGGETPRPRVIDTNVSLFQWPFRRLPLDEPDALLAKLRSLGISQAWASSFEGVLHRDVTSVNQRLADCCKRHAAFVPIGTVNPALPDWEHDLRQCGTVHKMPGIRLHPNYHGYKLDDERFARLLKLATSAGLFVQIATAMEDTRTHHHLVQVPDVDLSPLPRVIQRTPRAKVQILNHRFRPPQAQALAKTPGIFFDTARVDGTDGVPNLIDGVPAGRVLYGSHAPFLVPQAALIRVHESGRLKPAALRACYSENAEGFLSGE